MLDSNEARKNCDPPVPEDLNDRAADLWRELFKIAFTAGQSWLDRTWQSALANSQLVEDEDDHKVLLLGNCRSFFESIPDTTRFPSSEIVSFLNNLESSPWMEWSHGQPLSTAGLARVLKGFGIRPHAAKVNNSTLQCYELEDFKESFERYLRKSSNPQPNNSNFNAANELDGCCPVEVADVKCNHTRACCTSKVQLQPYDYPTLPFPENEIERQNPGLYIRETI
jgi:hypothetical protein